MTKWPPHSQYSAHATVLYLIARRVILLKIDCEMSGRGCCLLLILGFLLKACLTRAMFTCDLPVRLLPDSSVCLLLVPWSWNFETFLKLLDNWMKSLLVGIVLQNGVEIL